MSRGNGVMGALGAAVIFALGAVAGVAFPDGAGVDAEDTPRPIEAAVERPAEPGPLGAGPLGAPVPAGPPAGAVLGPGLPTLAVNDLGRKYNGAEWFKWEDADRDCLNTRMEVLIAESEVPVTFSPTDRCRVATGRWTSPYTGAVETDARRVDVDHLVATEDAHRSGGAIWSPERRRAYTNDLTNPNTLVAVPASENSSKGSRGPEDWLPPNLEAACDYVRQYALIKQREGLTAPNTQIEAIRKVRAACPS